MEAAVVGTTVGVGVGAAAVVVLAVPVVVSTVTAVEVGEEVGVGGTPGILRLARGGWVLRLRLQAVAVAVVMSLDDSGGMTGQVAVVVAVVQVSRRRPRDQA